MGGKKIVGVGELQNLSTPCVLSTERLTTSGSGKAGSSYPGFLKIGILGGNNGKHSFPPERIVEPADGMKGNGNGNSSSSQSLSEGIGECHIHESLKELSLHHSVEHNMEYTAGNTLCGGRSAVIEGAADTGVTDAGGDILDNSSDCSIISKEEWKCHVVEYKSADSSSQPVSLHLDYDLHNLQEKEFRPPTLILPDPTAMEADFGSQQDLEGDYSVAQSLHLPSCLVASPHDGKHNLLDPNAREFTPSPSPCPSPVLASTSLVPIAVPTPYHIEPPHFGYPSGVGGELGHVNVMYSGDFAGIPIYTNGAPITYGPIASSSTLSGHWDGQHIGMGLQGLQGDLQHHLPPGSGPLAPPSMVAQNPQTHTHLLRPYGIPAAPLHSYIPSCCSPPMGSPTGSLPALAVPPPLTGREHVSRALLLSGVPTDITDFQLKQELEQWGLVRALGLERRQEGLVTVHFYDLRHAKEALREIQQQHLLQQQRIQQKFQQMQRQQRVGGMHLHCEIQQEKHETYRDSLPEDEASSCRGLIGGKAVWAQYTVPVGAAAGPDSHNQGTLVVFNLDADMPLEELRAAFEAHGAVKELRETPAKRQHKFVEFYDVRDAVRALAALDGHEIGGKRVKIEFSRPGGQARRARAQAQAQVLAQQGGPIAPIVGNRLSTAGALPSLQGQQLYLGWGTDPGMIPSQQMAPPPGPPAYMWANFGHVPPVSPLSALIQQQQWSGAPAQLQALSYPQLQQGAPPSPGLGVPGLVHIGSDPMHGRQFVRSARGVAGFSGSGSCSSVGSNFHGGLSGYGRYGHIHHSGSSSARACDEPCSRRRRGGGGSSSTSSNGSLMKMGIACLSNTSVENVKQEQGSEIISTLRESPRGYKTGLTPKSSAREHGQYAFETEEAELNSESPRTTLMIKNIPNKYSQQMLLALLDQHCLCCNQNIVDPTEPQSAYDFVYLPIDFKNRCNLGYAFVNFTTVQATLKLYKSFHAQLWEAFNSRKICQVTYARVQGRVALEEHFRNSRFACDTDEYLPLVFSPPRTGLVCPSPTVAAGHLTGRSLCSSRSDQSCRVRNCDLQDKCGAITALEQPQSNTSSLSEEDSESPTTSCGANGGGAAGTGTSATAGCCSHHGVRRPNGGQQLR